MWRVVEQVSIRSPRTSRHEILKTQCTFYRHPRCLLHKTEDDDCIDNYLQCCAAEGAIAVENVHERDQRRRKRKVEDAKSLTNHSGGHSITARSERLASFRLAQSFGREETHKPLSRGHCATRRQSTLR
jgi:hypothetical protein